jgi:hypothetical protein
VAPVAGVQVTAVQEMDRQRQAHLDKPIPAQLLDRMVNKNLATVAGAELAVVAQVVATEAWCAMEIKALLLARSVLVSAKTQPIQLIEMLQTETVNFMLAVQGLEVARPTTALQAMLC